jgi:hypothetical protein
MNRLLLSALAVAMLGWVAPVDAGQPCHHCGCCQGCKVCRLVPEVTKVTTIKYSLECSDICLHAPSKCVGTKQVCGCFGPRCEPIMQPSCGRVKTIAKLVKTPVVEEKHGWKCVVVRCCGQCRGANAEARDATDVEKRLALQAAEQLGILQVSATEPIEVTIPDDAAAPAPVPATPAPKKAMSALFGSLFD